MSAVKRARALRNGDVVWIQHHGNHPGVVMSVQPLVVMVGSGTERAHLPEVCIKRGSPASKLFPLYKDTYFNSSRVAIEGADAAISTVVGKTCPPNVFRALATLLQPSASATATASASPGSPPPTSGVKP